MKNRSIYIYLGVALIIAIGAYSAQFLEIETDLDGYSLASEKATKAYEKEQEQFASKGTNHPTILILENENKWDSFEDYKMLDELTQYWDNVSNVQKTSSLTGKIYPRRALFGMKNTPFLDVSSEARFNKRFEGLDRYSDIVEAFLSKDKRYTLLYVRMKKGRSMTEFDVRDFRSCSAIKKGIKVHFLNHNVIQDEVKDLVRTDSMWLAALSTLFILLTFYLLTRSLKGLMLIWTMIVFNLACTILVMLLLDLPFTIHSITVPCLVIILSFTDIMHIIYHHRKLKDAVADNDALKRQIVEAVRVPMLITSLTNIVGFIIFLVLSENEFLFNFSLIAIVGVAIAYLSSRYIVVQLMTKENSFLVKTESRRLNNFQERIQNAISGQRKVALAVLFIALIAVCSIVVSQFEIGGFENDLSTENAPHLKASQILRDDFFGTKQLEIIATPSDSSFLESIVEMDEIEKEIDAIYDPLFVTSLPVILKRYNRFTQNGHPGAYVIPNSFPEETQRQFSGRIDELGGTGIEPVKGNSWKMVLGYKVDGLNASLQKYKKLEEVFKKHEGKVSFKLTGKQYISDKGSYSFTWKIIIGLCVGILFSSILTFLFIKSFKESIGLILVNFFPVVLSLSVMLMMGIEVTPVTLFFLSLLAGICVDDSVYIITEKEKRISPRHSFPILVTTVVMMLGFVALGFSSFAWIQPFAWVFLLGLSSAFLLDLFILPLFFSKR